MPTATKKPPAKKATAAVAARREVRREKNTPKPLTVEFRGQKFDIPMDRVGAFVMRGQYIAAFDDDSQEQAMKLLFGVLGKVDSARFLDLLRPGDVPSVVVGEFVRAFNKAANVPNS